MSLHVRCRLCGLVLPGWLPVQDRPDGTMLLAHLSAMHPTEVTAYLDRMQGSEDIGYITMEAFGRVEASDQRA
jgi:hypothetical protein